MSETLIDVDFRACPGHDLVVDVLADVLRRIGVSGLILARDRYAEPFGFALDGRQDAGFHYVAAGSCWLRRAGERPLRLLQGDLVLLPRGDAHALVSPAAARATPIAEFLRTRRRAGRGDGATIVCGAYRLEAGVRHPLLDGLPRAVHLPAPVVNADPGLAATLSLLGRELDEELPGTEELVRHLVDALLYYVLRLLARRGEAPGWLSALSDPVAGAALRRMHAEPERDWTVGSLARAAGASRASLARRFGAAVGEPPRTYLTRWRMTLAARLLRESNLGLAAVAARVGYESEFAFSRAFKRVVGEAPAPWRRRTMPAA